MPTFTELHTSPILRATTAVGGMPAPTCSSIAPGPKLLLAAVGRIHPAEINTYLETCRRYGAHESMLRELQAFDPHGVTFEECFAGVDPMLIPTRALLYDVIRISKADEDYAKAEQDAVAKAAHLLGVDDDWVEKITALVDAENSLAALRLRLLAPAN